MVPSTAAGDARPTHPDLDPFWARSTEANIPFVLHIGGGAGCSTGRSTTTACRSPTTSAAARTSARRTSSPSASSPSVFLGALIYDGVFDRFPNLRGGVIEEGAGWVVSWMRHSTTRQRAFRRTEEPLASLALKPSEYVRRHLKFTPFPGEEVGWMIEQAGAELFMFSTDYPASRGRPRPAGEVRGGDGLDDDRARHRFFYGNMAELLGPPLVPSPAKP